MHAWKLFVSVRNDIENLVCTTDLKESSLLLIDIMKRVVLKFEEKNTLIYSHLICIEWSNSSRYSTAFINGP